MDNLTKICTKCNIEKSLSEFYKYKKGRFGVVARCKQCIKKINLIYYFKHIEVKKIYSKAYRLKHIKELKVYRIKNANKIKAQAKARHIKNKIKRNVYSRSYNAEHIEEKKAYDKIYRKTYYAKHKKKINAYYRQKYKTNVKIKLNKSMSVMIRRSLKGNKAGRSWESFVNYSLNDLKKHIKKQFTKGMTWKLFLEGKIEIDHKIPISVFNFAKSEHEDFKRCWALSNLQPLWTKDNRKKHTKLIKPFQPSLLL